MTAIVLAAAIIALAIYGRPAPPRYQAIAGDGKVVRIDTRTGTIIACEADQCMTILKRGQRLQRIPSQRLLPKQDAQRPQAPPAPPPEVAPTTR